MSATVEVPKGLDKLSAEEQRLMDSMRADDGPEPEPTRDPPPPREASVAKTPEPEPADIEIEDEPEAVAERPKLVPHEALHAERKKRQAAEAKAVELERETAAKMATLQERMNTLTAIATVASSVPPQAPAAPAAEEPLPDVNADPVGHFRAVAERQQQRLNEQAAILQGIQQRGQQDQQMAELRQWGAAQEQAFEAREPTYRAAVEHMLQSRRSELAAIGISDANEQRKIIANDITNIAIRARQEGADFGQRLYGLAELRGWKKPDAATAAADPVIPPLDAAPTATSRAEAGRDNAMTIGSLGAAPPTRLSVEKIANMSEKEFDALTKRMTASGADIRDIMGH